ncbi:hypothetical protein XocBAI15_17010 [Xanthomonas oryzae pv. oryzicola]|nr:hypothetical protein XocBAI15_17010 [Xanthomonas oryzae pv. oryzicola]OWB29611.1 hypothetical protein XocBAI20_10745 [Xanthomonas oryzae pv. oryzicola]OWB33418.1 hypothetical protein XocBAI21_03325 [Xanthomonas oryzae pv. oryzicola]
MAGAAGDRSHLPDVTFCVRTIAECARGGQHRRAPSRPPKAWYAANVSRQSSLRCACRACSRCCSNGSASGWRAVGSRSTSSRQLRYCGLLRSAARASLPARG